MIKYIHTYVHVHAYILSNSQHICMYVHKYVHVCVCIMLKTLTNMGMDVLLSFNVSLRIAASYSWISSAGRYCLFTHVKRNYAIRHVSNTGSMLHRTCIHTYVHTGVPLGNSEMLHFDFTDNWIQEKKEEKIS